jgi:beta-glucosidase
MPLKELKSFKKIPLKINEENTVSFSIPLTELEKWDDATHGWKLNKGAYTITAGGNAENTLLTEPITIK